MKSFITKIKTAALAVVMLASFVALPLVSAEPAFAATKDQLCEGAGLGTGCNVPSGEKTVPQIIASVVALLVYVIGAISVIFIIIGGVRYVTSNGDQAQVTSAKNTLLYAIIGLVVAIAAYGIVQFVVTQFTK